MFDNANLTAGSVMTKAVLTISPQATLREAAALMAQHGISALPVVESDGTVAGLLSEADLVRPDDAAEARRDWWLQHLADGENLASDFLSAIHTANRSVARLMRRDVEAVGELTPLKEVAALLTKKNIRRVLVLKDGKLAGILSRADLVRALAAGA